ncbi:eukaryotic translation initiation factor 4 gamma 1-like isoform X1 [Artemia franciscana]|uniref:eukaryotic translation initiation factor 4 gamma 1-like isoform X1 n=1 Tax=Artemia franciscana TaxID=6661 RepID=UPI0032DB68D7
MRKLSRSTNLSSAIRFMLIDVLELKERAWVPIRNEEYCRQSSSLSGNQEVKAPTQSLELERYELEGTIDESCHKVSQLGESVLNQEEALNLSRNKSIAAKSGIVATEPVVLDRYSRVSISNQTNVKNLKTNIVLQLNKLICDSPKKIDVSNFTGWLFHSNFIEIDAEKKIDVLVHVMYVKVTEKPEYAPKLAEVLKLLSEKEVPLVRGRGKVSLCQLIVNRCQQTFERHINSKEKIVSKQEALREAETEEKKAELLVKPDERIAKEKQVLLGFIRFAGELFNSKMLTIETMDFCISELLKLRTEGQLECLCELLSLIGKSYEQEYDAKYQRAVAESENTSQPLQFKLTKLDVYLNEMREICKGKSTDVSSRIRIMLTDVLDLKERAWIPHQTEENCQKEKRKRDRSSRKTDDS